MKVLTAIVGGRFHPGALERSKALKVGEPLVLMREPSNPFDKHAVAVMSSEGVKLGYVPRPDAPLVARALDLGIDIHASPSANGSTSITITWDN